jgi:chitin disaccharide deacetylase
MDLMHRRIALHADDLGMNRAVSEGILRGFREGLLTSTSLLANAPDAERALQQWKGLAAEHAEGRLSSAATRARLGDLARPFDLGVHLNLTQGRPLLDGRYPDGLLDTDGRFPGVFALFSRLRRFGERFCEGIRAELDQQVQMVCDHGLQPTHLNGHQYIEMIPAVAGLVGELLDRFGIKVVRVAREPSLVRSTVLRGCFWKWPLACVKQAFAERFRTRMDALGIAHPDAFFGTAHAGGVDLRLLRRFLASAREERLVEVGLHPGETSEGELPEDRADGWRDPLAGLRPDELRMLISAELPALLESAGWRLGRLAK